MTETKEVCKKCRFEEKVIKNGMCWDCYLNSREGKCAHEWHLTVDLPYKDIWTCKQCRKTKEVEK